MRSSVLPIPRFASLLRVGGAALLFLAAARCGDPAPAPTVGTNSNWLKICSTDADCDKLTCRCGGCTVACTSDADCASLKEARCATASDPAAETACASAPAGGGVCLPRCDPGGCTEEQACVSNGCVPLPMPAVPFCAPATHRMAADRTREDEVLALLQAIRAGTMTGCKGASAPPLRLSNELACADRVFADDIRTTRSNSATDSMGRTATARYAAAGFTAGTWWESNAVGARSAADAIMLMLGDPQACASWTNPALTSVGVGVSGDAVVATLANGG